jgi:hypothetical protein
MFNPTYWTSAERFEFKSRSLQISFQLRAAKNARCFTIETQRGVAATKSGESRIRTEYAEILISNSPLRVLSGSEKKLNYRNLD